ncbi:MAG: DUF1704 domain-containing protein [Deltaproteobacteria bacterium]|nr:DUF1704 domain-containing protein [Deltaproteobacteria bacterium]
MSVGEVVEQQVLERLKENRRINQVIPGIGRILIDHHLPYIVLYRELETPDEGTNQLATTEASFLIAQTPPRQIRRLRHFLLALQERSLQAFGVFLIVEIWSRTPTQKPVFTTDNDVRKPAIRLFSTPECSTIDNVMERLQRRLRDKTVAGSAIEVEIPVKQKDYKSRPAFVFSKPEANVYQLGIEVEPCFRAKETEAIFPVVLRNLRIHLSKALRYALYHFIRQETSHRLKNFNVLGRHLPGKTVWEIDGKLDEISRSFDFLLSINPVNVKELWTVFRKSNYEKVPVLRYRPLQVDVSMAKRALFHIPIERVEDPSLGHLFSEKQGELDRQLSMLKDRGTSRFMLGGHQLYGRITAGLVRKAEEILERVHGSDRRSDGRRTYSAEEFKKRALEEVAYYHNQWDAVQPKIRFSKDLIVGLMVSRGNLLIRPDIKMSPTRANALMQHEIGTHMVTWFNGSAQKLTQLRSGLASYEELQEGLAVLAEFMVGGLTPMRLRTLAARVLASHALMEGATFIDSFRFLCRYGFTSEQAFNITLRIFRGGGFIKDCIYLRGFEKVLRHLTGGNDLNILYCGKIALKHVAIIEELLARKVVSPPKLLPRFLSDDACTKRLKKIDAETPIYKLANG